MFLVVYLSALNSNINAFSKSGSYYSIVKLYAASKKDAAKSRSEDVGNNEEFSKYLKERLRQENDLSKDEKLKILSNLVTHVPSMDPGHIALTVLNAGTLFARSKQYLHSNFSFSSETFIKVIFYSNFVFLTNKERFLQHINYISPKFSKTDITSILVGLAKLDQNINIYNSHSNIDKLLSRIEILLPSMDSQCITDCLWSLGTLGIQWNDLSNELKITILKSLQHSFKYFNSYCMSSSLWALAKMGLKWNIFSHELQIILLNRISDLSYETSPQQSSKVLWSIGTIGFPWRSFPNGILEKYLEIVNRIKQAQVGNAIPFCQALAGLSKSGILWTEISPSFRTKIWDSLLRICLTSNIVGISNALRAVGMMGPSLELQPPAIRSQVLAGVKKSIIGAPTRTLSSSLYGLLKMGVMWEDLSEDLIISIYESIIILQKEMNAMDVGLLLRTLGCMDSPIDVYPKPVLQSLMICIERNLPCMQAQDLSHTLWGLSSGGLCWDQLSPTSKWGVNCALRRVVDTMVPQDVSTIAYSLACMCFDSMDVIDPAFRGVHETILEAVSKRCKENQIRFISNSHNNNNNNLLLHKENINELDVTDDNQMISGPRSATLTSVEELEQLRIFAHYLCTLKVVDEITRIPAYLLDSKSTVLENNNKRNHTVGASKLQRLVLNGLQDVLASSTDKFQENIIVIPEFSGFAGVFPIDAVVMLGDMVVALLEVDGPHHYRGDGQIRRSDLLKEALYRKKFPDVGFHRVMYVEANKLGASEVGADIANMVLADIERIETASGGIPGAMRRFTDYMFDFLDNGFKWTLRNTPTKEL